MGDDVHTIHAGDYTLVARTTTDGVQGAIWAQRKIVQRFTGSSLDDVWAALMTSLTSLQEDRVQARAGMTPTALEAETAFRRIEPRLHSGQKAMLRAHLRASDQCITAAQLAEAAGYRGHRSGNLHYGLVGAMLFAEIPEDLPRRKDGSRILTCSIASVDEQRETPKEDWIWRMRPHVAEGLEAARIL